MTDNLMWHFTTLDRRLGYGDGREVKAGQTLTVNGPIELCRKGLHASKNILDACSHAPGPYLWCVKLGGDVVHGSDKSAGTARTALWGYDATDVLRAFARSTALAAVREHWDVSRFGAFPAVAMQWLETGDASIRSAAWSAAESAAWSAAESAAESAAWSAAWSASWSAARSPRRPVRRLVRTKQTTNRADHRPAPGGGLSAIRRLPTNRS